MQSLERRVEELEKAAAPADPLVWFIRLVSPGRLGTPTVRMVHAGDTFVREDSETEEQFTSRVEMSVLATLSADRTVYCYDH
jgi:hypothetical protein